MARRETRKVPQAALSGQVVVRHPIPGVLKASGMNGQPKTSRDSVDDQRRAILTPGGPRRLAQDAQLQPFSRASEIGSKKWLARENGLQLRVLSQTSWPSRRQYRSSLIVN